MPNIFQNVCTNLHKHQQWLNGQVLLSHILKEMGIDSLINFYMIFYLPPCGFKLYFLITNEDTFSRVYDAFVSSCKMPVYAYCNFYFRLPFSFWLIRNLPILSANPCLQILHVFSSKLQLVCLLSSWYIFRNS